MPIHANIQVALVRGDFCAHLAAWACVGPTVCCMPEPSRYERRAWDQLESTRAHPLTRASRVVGNATSQAVGWAGERASQVMDRSAALQKLRDSAGDTARRVGDAVPDAVETWASGAVGSVQSFLARSSRIGLTPERVIRRHVAAGHDVVTLEDVRTLDLELVDKVRGRSFDLGYVGAATASGTATALALTGGVIVAGSGAGAAPGALTVVGAIAADAAAVLGITSRAVGHVALSYGYDPEDPSEKLIVRAVINAGAATTTATRTAALQDLSKLTQLLYRGAPWAQLDASVISRALTEFAKRFGVKFTKDTLGKVVPGVGIAVSATMNAATVESIVEEANRVYRRRFLKEKYPQLGAGDLILRPTPAPEDPAGAVDEISVVEILEDVLEDRDDDKDGVVA